MEKCKFIDCFYRELKDPYLNPSESTREYLFSACVPKRFNKPDTLNVCKEVALGNDYIDYFESKGDEDAEIIHKWKWGVGGAFGTTVIIVIAILTCLICGASCFYNYRLHHN